MLKLAITESSGLVVITAAVHSGGPGFDPGGRPPWGGLLWFPSPPPGEYRGGATTSRPQPHTFLPCSPYSSLTVHLIVHPHKTR